MGGREGRGGTGEGTARSQYPTSDLTTLDLRHLPAEILVSRVASIFLDSLERGRSWGRGAGPGRGRGLMGWICKATFSIACSHTRSLNPSPSLQRTHHRDQSSYISHFYSHVAMVSASLLFFVVFFKSPTGNSRVVALGWTAPADVSISQLQVGGSRAQSRDHSSGRRRGVGASHL